MFQSMGQHLYILLLVGAPTKTWHPLEGFAQTVIGSEKQTTCFQTSARGIGRRCLLVGSYIHLYKPEQGIRRGI